MKIGDVVLVRSTGLKAGANLFGQFLKTGKKSAFTHVMVCVNENVVMDATMEDGIALRNVIHEVIKGHLSSAMCNKGRLMVLRSAKLDVNITSLIQNGENQNVLKEIINLTAAQLHKKYKMAFGISSPSDMDPHSTMAEAAFCSELVALTLRPLGVLPKGWKVPSKIFPVHFQRLENVEGWRNVTKEWCKTIALHQEQANTTEQRTAESLGARMALANASIAQMTGYRAFKDNVRKTTDSVKTVKDMGRMISQVRRDLQLLTKANPNLRTSRIRHKRTQ